MDTTDKGRYTYPKRNICEVHRELYDHLVIELAVDRPDVIDKLVPLIEEMFIMGIKMNKALVEKKLSQDFTAPFQDQNEIAVRRQERVDLLEMLKHNNQVLKVYEDQTP